MSGKQLLLIMSKSARGLDTRCGEDLYLRARIEVICVFIYSYLSALPLIARIDFDESSYARVIGMNSTTSEIYLHG